MRDDLPGDGLKNMWLSQPTEIPTMTLKVIQQRSRSLRAKTRRKLLGTLAGPLGTCLFFAFAIREFASVRELLQALFAVALAWSVAGLYFLNRGMWPGMGSEDRGLRSGLEFCRREIGRQRDLVRRSLLWSFGPMLLAIGTFVLALAMASTKDRSILPNGLPFLALIVVWIVVYFIISWREQRQLKAEIADLDDIEKENHAV